MRKVYHGEVQYIARHYAAKLVSGTVRIQTWRERKKGLRLGLVWLQNLFSFLYMPVKHNNGSSQSEGCWFKALGSPLKGSRRRFLEGMVFLDLWDDMK